MALSSLIYQTFFVQARNNSLKKETDEEAQNVI